MPSNTSQLQQDYDLAVAELSKAGEAVKAFDGAALTPSAAQARLTKLRNRFDLAEQKAESAKAALNTAKARATAIPDSTIDARVTSESLTYEKGNPQVSFFRDLLNVKSGDLEAQNRLGRHKAEMRVEASDLYALNSTDTTGGDFVPPFYILNEWAEAARGHRPFTSAMTLRQLPDYSDTIVLPKVSTGGTVAAQTDGNSVSSTDPATTGVSIPVNTVAGQVDLSRQSFERSAPGLDVVISQDLIGAYNEKVESLAITGSGSAGQPLGILSVGSTNAVTYTDASPTVPELYAKLGDAIQQVAVNRKQPADLIVVHPRRWAWFLSALDSQNRPLVVPSEIAVNSSGTQDGAPREGIVGTLMGLPVVASVGVPTTSGSGTNEDRIIVTRTADNVIYEQPPVVRVFEDVLSATGQVRIQAFGYVGIDASKRYPTSTSIISGTGLANPW